MMRRLLRHEPRLRYDAGLRHGELYYDAFICAPLTMFAAAVYAERRCLRLTPFNIVLRFTPHLFIRAATIRR